MPQRRTMLKIPEGQMPDSLTFLLDFIAPIGGASVKAGKAAFGAAGKSASIRSGKGLIDNASGEVLDSLRDLRLMSIPAVKRFARILSSIAEAGSGSPTGQAKLGDELARVQRFLAERLKRDTKDIRAAQRRF